MTGIRRTSRIVALACCLGLAPVAAQAQVSTPSLVESGHSALWFDPARSGEGWVLEVIGDGQAALGWFTYDEDGGQRWLFGLGQIVEDATGQRIDFADLYTSTGGRFGPDFDPEAIERERVGEASMRFVDCERGSFSYSAFGQSQTLPVRRIAYTMAAGCRSINGVPGEPIQAYAAQSGSWYDPARSGEGFQLQWTSRNEALLGWYTFDGEGNQFWMTGQGYREADRIVFPALYSTRGGRFGEAFDAAEVERTEWGSLVLELNCDAGTARYESSLPGFGSGELPLLRLTGAVPVACPWTAPKLTDLYDVEVIELPVEATTTPDPDSPIGSGNQIRAQAVANDGTVAAARKLLRMVGGAAAVYYRSARLRLDSMVWETESQTAIRTPVLISSDGGTMLTAAERGATASFVVREPVFIRDGAMEPLLGQIYDTTSYPRGASEDLSYVVGGGLRPAPSGSGGWFDTPWIWDAERGQVELPRTEDVPGPFATAVSGDGSIVIGLQPHVREFPGFPQSIDLSGSVGVRWAHGQAPHLLRDGDGRYLGMPDACSADCGIVLGDTSWATRDENGILRGERRGAWFWKDPDDVVYLGALSATEENPAGWTYSLRDVSSDGSMAVGSYRSPEMVDSLPNGWSADGALIWTQNTGFVPVQPLLEEIGRSLGWPSMRAIGISPNGAYILLSSGEIFEEGPRFGSPSSQYTALLRLVEKPR